MSDFSQLLAVDVLVLLLAAAGVQRGHVQFRRRPADRKQAAPKEGVRP